MQFRAATRFPTDQVVAAFQNITNNGTSQPTYSQIESFVENNFLGEGCKLVARVSRCLVNSK